MAADVLRPGEENDLPVSIGLAVGLHVALLLILVLAGWLQQPPMKISVAGPVVQATLMISTSDVAVAERSMEDAPKPEPEDMAPAPQPLPVPAPQDEPEPIQPTPQEQQPEPDTVDQEAVARLAEQAAEEEQRRIQEERQRQEQVDLTERIRQDEAERRRNARQQQLDELRRERADAERRTRMEEQRLAQLADREPAPTPAPTRSEAPPQPAGGNNGTDTDLRARYVLALTQAIERNWIRPETVSPDTVCPIRIIQARGGTVISAEVLPGCGYDALGQRSVEAAVLRAQPLPYEGFESVFARDLKLNFRATEN
jgi:colicin import membrane protein